MPGKGGSSGGGHSGGHSGGSQGGSTHTGGGGQSGGKGGGGGGGGGSHPMSQSDASRIQAHADKTGTNADFKASAQSAAQGHDNAQQQGNVATPAQARSSRRLQQLTAGAGGGAGGGGAGSTYNVGGYHQMAQQPMDQQWKFKYDNGQDMGPNSAQSNSQNSAASGQRNGFGAAGGQEELRRRIGAGGPSGAIAGSDANGVPYSHGQYGGGSGADQDVYRYDVVPPTDAEREAKTQSGVYVEQSREIGG